MAENRYWFARRYPVGNPRNAMSPVTPEGYRVVWTFVGFMIGGAVAWMLLSVAGLWFWPLLAVGPIVFIAAAAYGGWFFIRQAQGRGDHQHTIADYKAGRVPPQAS